MNYCDVFLTSSIVLLCLKLVESILTKKPGGECIINEYNRSKFLTDETRRKMVNILAADMTEKNT